MAQKNTTIRQKHIFSVIQCENISWPDGPVISETDWPSYIFTGHGPALKSTPVHNTYTSNTSQKIMGVDSGRDNTPSNHHYGTPV